MVLDAFGIDFGGFPADADGKQAVDHDLGVPPPSPWAFSSRPASTGRSTPAAEAPACHLCSTVI
jgi:hypothetical protein